MMVLSTRSWVVVRKWHGRPAREHTLASCEEERKSTMISTFRSSFSLSASCFCLLRLPSALVYNHLKEPKGEEYDADRHDQSRYGRDTKNI